MASVEERLARLEHNQGVIKKILHYLGSRWIIGIDREYAFDRMMKEWKDE